MVDAIDWSALLPNVSKSSVLRRYGLLDFLTCAKSEGQVTEVATSSVNEKSRTSSSFLRFSWVVQCKHTSRLDKASIAKDLAAALEHRPDVWWLMTSASVSPDFPDFLTKQSRAGLQPFRVGYLDGRLLSRIGRPMHNAEQVTN